VLESRVLRVACRAGMFLQDLQVYIVLAKHQ
jgi:hypothetical protein